LFGCNQYRHAKFTGIIKSYLEEELPSLPNTKEDIRIFILKLIELRYVKKIGTQPTTTYEFREDEISWDGKQKKIL